MAQKSIREYDAKNIFKRHFKNYFPSFECDIKSVLVKDGSELKNQAKQHPWLKDNPLVVKPDMLFGKRGLNQLVFLKDKKTGDVNLDSASKWIQTQMKEPKKLRCGTLGSLNAFIVEPFILHDKSEEYYICCSTQSDHDLLLLSTSGGVDIEDSWDLVEQIKIPAVDIDPSQIKDLISKNLPKGVKNSAELTSFAEAFYNFFKDMHFSYLEFNPFILKEGKISVLDVVAKVDDTANFLMHSQWGDLEFPPAFGEKEPTCVERNIEKIDANSGSSLKLTILNPKALVWTLVAGGGASVVYADTIANVWGANELANYGEYSGNPTTEETFLYAKGVFELMCQEKDSQGRDKILIIGGSIANFTDVAKTFDGIIKALKEMNSELKKVGTRIYVRRGGPNYEIGLKNIETAAKKLELPIQVFGPETHLTEIVCKAQQELIQGAVS